MTIFIVAQEDQEEVEVFDGDHGLAHLYQDGAVHSQRHAGSGSHHGEGDRVAAQPAQLAAEAEEVEGTNDRGDDEDKLLFEYDGLPEEGNEHTLVGEHEAVSQRDTHQELFRHLIQGVILVKEGEDGQGEESTH